MIYELSTKITNKLVKKDIIQEENAEVYTYGFEIIMSSLLIFSSMLALGILFRCLVEVIVFIIFFAALRVQAGGYHAKTHMQCFAFFALSCFLAILMTKLLLGYDKNYIIIILILIESCIIIMTYAPVDTDNKPLTETEKIKYKRKSIITVIIQTSIILLVGGVYSNKLQSYYMVAAFAILIEAMTVLPIINKRRKRGQNMLTRINKKIGTQVLGLIGLLGVAVASLSIQTACIWFFNQPKVPEQLRKND